MVAFIWTSWRGYWQELIDSIVWSHSVTPVVTDKLTSNNYHIELASLSTVQPAVDVGLSVTTVGNTVQWDGMKLVGAAYIHTSHSIRLFNYNYYGHTTS